VVRVSLPGAGTGATPVIAALVSVLALALLLAAWRMLPRRPALTGAPGSHADADRLLDQIAGLDAQYQGREAETPAEEWARYRERRAVLKADAEAALAQGPRRP
jgi:hypothetical protein